MSPKHASTTPNRLVPSPAVRQWIYNVFIAALAVAAGYGIISAESGGLWVTFAAAVLELPVVTARANVPKASSE